MIILLCNSVAGLDSPVALAKTEDGMVSVRMVLGIDILPYADHSHQRERPGTRRGVALIHAKTTPRMPSDVRDRC